MQPHSEGYIAGQTTLEVRVGDHTFTAVVPAMLTASDTALSETSSEDYLVDGEVIADFELRIAKWWCEREELPGAALKFVRHTLGLKQTQLAELLGFKAETLSRWENGERPVPRLVRVVLANIIIDRMMGDEQTMERLRGAHEPPPDVQRIELGRFQLRRPGAVLEPVRDESGGINIR